jgi:hypothetical protein
MLLLQKFTISGNKTRHYVIKCCGKTKCSGSFDKMKNSSRKSTSRQIVTSKKRTSDAYQLTKTTKNMVASFLTLIFRSLIKNYQIPTYVTLLVKQTSTTTPQDESENSRTSDQQPTEPGKLTNASTSKYILTGS